MWDDCWKFLCDVITGRILDENAKASQLLVDNRTMNRIGRSVKIRRETNDLFAVGREGDAMFAMFLIQIRSSVPALCRRRTADDGWQATCISHKESSDKKSPVKQLVHADVEICVKPCSRHCYVSTYCT